jgi:hypothetical protein
MSEIHTNGIHCCVTENNIPREQQKNEKELRDYWMYLGLQYKRPIHKLIKIKNVYYIENNTYFTPIHANSIKSLII